MSEISFPRSVNPNQTSDVITTAGSIVVVGPNGSGKTRLGSWIEFESPVSPIVHRISAQKSLSMPWSVSPEGLERAEDKLIYGTFIERKERELSIGHRKMHRWKNKLDTVLLDDYQQLVIYLFSENYEQILRYKDASRKTPDRLEPPLSKLDRTKGIWEYLLPHRELIIKSGSLEAQIRNSNQNYNAAELSDGERVIFYLIGECLAAPDNGVIVIDEPELHLHRSIQRKLWDRVEQERKDCIFIYLTHDLEFAATRIGANKICLNGFDGTNFDWYEIPAGEAIPEQVYLEVLGSRSPVLFVEGAEGSYDNQVYQYIYPDFTIRPIGSCEKVIQAVKVFNSLANYHRVRAFGIIDRDYKDEHQLEAYAAAGVFAPELAEVENVLLIEPVLIEVARQLYLPEPEMTVQEIKTWVIFEFDRLKEYYALEYTSHVLNNILNGFDGRARSKEELIENVRIFVNEKLSVEQIYADALKRANELIAAQDYDAILLIFKHKGLLGQVGKFLRIQANGYAQKVKDIIRAGNVSIIEHMRARLPRIPSDRPSV